MSNVTINVSSKERKMEVFIGRWLRFGAYSSAIIAIIGGVLYLSQQKELPDYNVFSGAAPQYTHLPGILNGVMALDGAAVIQMAAVILIATPILRIVFSVFAFAAEKDRMYVLITLIVLSIILFGMFSGLG